MRLGFAIVVISFISIQTIQSFLPLNNPTTLLLFYSSSCIVSLPPSPLSNSTLFGRFSSLRVVLWILASGPRFAFLRCFGELIICLLFGGLILSLIRRRSGRPAGSSRAVRGRSCWAGPPDAGRVGLSADPACLWSRRWSCWKNAAWRWVANGGVDFRVVWFSVSLRFGSGSRGCWEIPWWFSTTSRGSRSCCLSELSSLFYRRNLPHSLAFILVYYKSIGVRWCRNQISYRLALILYLNLYFSSSRMAILIFYRIRGSIFWAIFLLRVFLYEEDYSMRHFRSFYSYCSN